MKYELGHETRTFYTMDTPNSDGTKNEMCVIETGEPLPPSPLKKFFSFVAKAIFVLFLALLVWGFFKSADYSQELRNVAIQKDVAEIQYGIDLFGEWLRTGK